MTTIAISLSVIAIQMTIGSANAQRVDIASGMTMHRMCERSSGTIYCADVTPDFHLKVEVKDLDSLPYKIATQIREALQTSQNPSQSNAIQNLQNQMRQNNDELYSKLSIELNNVSDRVTAKILESKAKSR